jgi:CRISPR/Cas system-associated exonuclease Cas4 (RecB family)
MDDATQVPIRMATDDSAESRSEDTAVDARRLEESLEAITSERFDEWYQHRTFRQNIRDGKPYFNGPSSVPPPERHSPSSLLQCHRKIQYRQENAPEEQDDAEGILWTGRRVEEDIVLPFLQEVVGTEQIYVRNSMWIDFTAEVINHDIRIKGVTDPVLVDEDSNPLMPTEVKTTSSLEYKDSPNTHHRAQLHAYLAGLSDKSNQDLSEGVLIYVSRETLEMKSFHVEFDPDFWQETVLEWAKTHTEYRLDDELPPASPEQDWECKYCSYRERCGKGDLPHANLGPRGFLPNYDSYPRNKVRIYFAAHDNAKLTPTLAEKYPDLAEEYAVQSWECPNCSTSFEANDITDDLAEANQPLCPQCAASEKLVELQTPRLYGVGE